MLLGGTVPQFGRGVELGGRVWYPVRLLHISYNLFAGTKCYLSQFTSQSQYKFSLGDRPPIWPRGRGRAFGVVPRETPPYY